MIGRSPAHELVQAAEAVDQLVAGVEEQVEGVAEHHVVAEARRPRPAVRPLTVALVASGTNAGVRTSPCAVRRTPARAREPRIAGVDLEGRHRVRHARPGALATLVDVAENIGLPVLFALVAVETMGVPLPGETALVTAAHRRLAGNLAIEAVIVVAAAAAILGDNVGFAIGRRSGAGCSMATAGRSTHRRKRLIEVGRAVLRPPRPEGRVPRPLVVGPADHRRLAGRRQPRCRAPTSPSGTRSAASLGLTRRPRSPTRRARAETAFSTAGLAGAGGACVGAAVRRGRLRHRRARAADVDAERGPES